MSEPCFTKSFEALDKALAPAFGMIDLLADDAKVGRPPAAHRYVHLAVVVAAVGAWQTFVESVALQTADILGLSGDQKNFLSLTSQRDSKVQTPNAGNVRALLYSVAGFDPEPHWVFAAQTSQVELSSGKSAWRSYTTQFSPTSKPRAVDALNAFVKLRHELAHGDLGSAGFSNKGGAKDPIPGVSTANKDGQWIVQSHHAVNAVKMTLQLAIATENGLRQRLDDDGSDLRNPAFKKSFESWNPYLDGTPAVPLVLAWRARAGAHAPTRPSE